MRISLQTAVKNAEAREARAAGFTTEFKNVPFFKLEDKQTAVIRFLFDDPSSITVVRTHMLQMFSKQGKPYYTEVSCIADEGGCPLCEAKSGDVNNEDSAISFAHDRMVLPLVVLERGGKETLSYELFVRPISFYTGVILPYSARFSLTEPIEITRTGTKANTSYTMFPPVDPDKYKLDKTLEELKADLGVQDTDVIGRVDSIIKTWTVEQMDFYINTRQNPTKSNMQGGNKKEEETQPITRRSANHHGF